MDLLLFPLQKLYLKPLNNFSELSRGVLMKLKSLKAASFNPGKAEGFLKEAIFQPYLIFLEQDFNPVLKMQFYFWKILENQPIKLIVCYHR